MDAEELDTLLGDPWDAANPLGFTAVFDADERHVMSKETPGERTKKRAGDEHPFFKSSDIHTEHRRRRRSVPHRPHRYSRS